MVKIIAKQMYYDKAGVIFSLDMMLTCIFKEIKASILRKFIWQFISYCFSANQLILDCLALTRKRRSKVIS